MRDRWRTDTLPVHAFLVEHPAGLLLFDTGQTARAADRGYLPRWHPFLRLSRFELTPADEVAAQLGEAGVSPQDIRWVLLSHLHTDHVGGLEPFAHAEVLVSRIEWALGNGLRGRVRGYVPQHWPKGLVPHLLDLAGPPVGPFGGSYDLVGDGTLVVAHMPGHTSGHVGLIIRGDRTFLLAGDLVHAKADLARVAPEVAAWCEQHDVIVLATHDPEADRPSS